MKYNWQLKNWPLFDYQIDDEIEQLLLVINERANVLAGSFLSLSKEKRNQGLSEIITEESVSTSEIEGEYISRVEVMSSVLHQLDQASKAKIKDRRVKGVSQMMFQVRNDYNAVLTKELLCRWHQLLLQGDPRITLGDFRSKTAPMQIVSGSVGREKVHFEAPPSNVVLPMMNDFFDWYNSGFPSTPKEKLYSTIRSAIAHLYFESIHPFEDGNGRIGRAIAEKALAEGLGRSPIISLSKIINQNKKEYYNALMIAQGTLNIDSWIKYFLRTIDGAFKYSDDVIQWTIKKWGLMNKYQGQLNKRQQKVLLKMLETFQFEGAMSAKKYMSITKTSKATATRDLQNLTSLGVLKTTGGGRSVRYEVNLEEE